jgi:hypothetical protein
MTNHNRALSINITSNNQSGGITAHTVNVNSKYQRQLGDAHRKQFLLSVPRDKEVVIWATMGNEEAHNLASQIFEFLKESQYRLFGEGPLPQIFIQQFYGVRVVVADRTSIEVGLMSESEKMIQPVGGVRMTIPDSF